MEEVRFLSVETCNEAGKVLRFSCSYLQGLCALKAVRRLGAVLLVFNEWLHPDDAVVPSCNLCVEGNKD